MSPITRRKVMYMGIAGFSPMYFFGAALLMGYYTLALILFLVGSIWAFASVVSMFTEPPVKHWIATGEWVSEAELNRRAFKRYREALGIKVH